MARPTPSTVKKQSNRPLFTPRCYSTEQTQRETHQLESRASFRLLSRMGCGYPSFTSSITSKLYLDYMKNALRKVRNVRILRILTIPSVNFCVALSALSVLSTAIVQIVQIVQSNFLHDNLGKVPLQVCQVGQLCHAIFAWRYWRSWRYRQDCHFRQCIFFNISSSAINQHVVLYTQYIIQKPQNFSYSLYIL